MEFNMYGKKFVELPYSMNHNAPKGADNLDQCPESFSRYFIENYSKEGDRILDPFIGYGTTAFVAENLGRLAYGVEADQERYEWCAGQLENWQNIVNGDAAEVAEYGFPKMDLCIASPPYMLVNTKWNPLYGGDPDFSGYDNYIDRIGYIFEQVAKVMKKGSLVIVQADNLQGRSYTPLAHDFYQQIIKSLKPKGEVLVRWVGDRPNFCADFEYTQALIFKKL